MLKVARPVIRSLMAWALLGWRFCRVLACEFQVRSLRKLADRCFSDCITTPECFEAVEREPSSDFLALRGLWSVVKTLRKAAECLSWPKPAPEFLIVKHSLSGREVYADRIGSNRRSVELEDYFPE